MRLYNGLKVVLLEEQRPQLCREKSHSQRLCEKKRYGDCNIFLRQLSESMRADWSRAKVYESIDHGNDVTCHAVPVVLFLAFCKKNQYYCTKQIDHNFPRSTLL